jgi:predicted transcriptional regulator
MGKDITIAARIEGKLDEQLRDLAAATGRSKSWHVAEAIKGYVTAEQEFLDAVAEGMRDVKAGRVTPHRVVAEFERRRRPRNGCCLDQDGTAGLRRHLDRIEEKSRHAPVRSGG